MVIVQKRSGQLGNQLFLMAHFAASAIENNYKVIYPNFEHSLKHYPNINDYYNFRVYQSSDITNKVIHGIFKSIRLAMPSSPFHECLYSEVPPYIGIGDEVFSKNAQKKLIACEGFGFRDPRSTVKHQSEIAKLFSFSKEIKENVDNYIKSNINPSDVVVGFHIRRKDYRSYCNGRYCYDDQTWIKWIEDVQNLFSKKNKKFCGVIFSDETVSSIINSRNNLLAAPGDMFCDLEMLSRCDYILGPPSTFSGWASFIAKVPKLNLETKDTRVNLNDFIVTSW